MSASPTMYLPFSNWRLKPQLGESARGYFLRLVTNEGHYSATVYGNEVGINGRSLFPEETLDAVLKLPLGDEHKAALRRFTPQPDGAYHVLGGQRLRQRQMAFSSRRFCRACLADNPYHRAWWDIFAFRTCPEHGTPIEDVDASGQPIGWWWADVASDTNGNLLARSAPSQADCHSRTLETFILERLDIAPKKAWPLLNGYNLYEVIEACEYLGMWLGNERTFDVPTDQRANLAIGMKAVSGTWEEMVSAMRNWFMEHTPADVRRQGKMESMGWAWKAWPHMSGTTIGKMLKDAATEAFEPIGKMGKKRFRETNDFYAEKALSSLAHDLGVKMDALIPLAQHLNLVPNTREAWELHSDQAARLRASVADLVPLSEVSRMLGFESWEWQGLIASGRLTAFSNFALARMFLKSEVDKFVAGAVAKVSSVPATSISIRTYARTKGVSVSDVLLLILDEGIVAVRAGGDQAGLRSIRIPKRFSPHNADINVENDAARRAFGLEMESSDQRMTGCDIWTEFRALANMRCPLFAIPEKAPEGALKIRTATAKVAVEVVVDKEAGTISLGFDLHPAKTTRRWKVFQRGEAEIREALGFMDWKRSADGDGWRLSITVRNPDYLALGVDALVALHGLFK